MPTNPEEIVSFWLGTDQNSVSQMKRQWKLWYQANPDTDNTIRESFGQALADAENGQLNDWQETPVGSLALVILLDQFSRNLFRGTPDAYRNDSMALAIADHAINSDQHLALSVAARVMLYHPYHHAEHSSEQQKAVALFTELRDTSGEQWQDELEKHLKFVRGHADVVERFGRFPHRNAIIGRNSTPEEKAHLEKDNRNFGQTQGQS